MIDDPFEWDDRKAEENWRKHRVTFAEAATVWGDLRRVRVYDDKHSDKEDRMWFIGMSGRSRVFTVVYCERGVRFRIISARKADAYESELYKNQDW